MSTDTGLKAAHSLNISGGHPRAMTLTLGFNLSSISAFTGFRRFKNASVIVRRDTMSHMSGFPTTRLSKMDSAILMELIRKEAGLRGRSLARPRPRPSPLPRPQSGCERGHSKGQAVGDLIEPSNPPKHTPEHHVTCIFDRGRRRRNVGG